MFGVSGFQAVYVFHLHYSLNLFHTYKTMYYILKYGKQNVCICYPLCYVSN
jgi:hypothetical protein